MHEIHIPPGINYECSSCGNCCLQWPVPLTRADADRMENLQWPPGRSRLVAEVKPLRRSAETKLRTFTATLEKRSDGKCEFLTEDNLCKVHQEFGNEAKPSMCQLFPYTFSPTPSGVYVSVSFASSGALFNHGRPLSEQADLLEQKYALFRNLFPDLEADWSQTQLLDGLLLDWNTYLQYETEMLRLVSAEQYGRVEKRLLACSRYLAKQLPSGVDLEKAPPMEARPKIVDQILLNYLHRFYISTHQYADDVRDIEARAILQELVKPPNTVRFADQLTVQELLSCNLGQLDPAIENLLHRFAFCRLFAKLYFGYGFANLSVIAGVNHLAVLISLIRLEMKVQMIRGKKPDLPAVAELVRTLERRLTQASFSRETSAVLEILLRSSERLDRIVSLAA
jgi:Fe-S-cluster containining protein